VDVGYVEAAEKASATEAVVTSDEKLAVARQRYVDRCAADAAGSFDRWIGMAKLESPIEKLFFAEALRGGWDVGDQWDWRQATEWFDFIGAKKRGLILCHHEFGHMVTQPEFCVRGQVVRPDLLVHVVHPDHEHAIVVELDGHDFHELTKEQARRDRSRERLLVRAGFLVLRFTGSEVWRDAARCWGELDDLVTDLYLREATG
jgi:Protein of unknown function (DUF559)